MTKFSHKEDGSDVFLMENKVRTFCRIPYLWQGWIETRNLPAFPPLSAFLDRHDKNKPPGTQANIMQKLENLSAQFVSYCCWQKNLIVEACGLIHCVVWFVSLMLKSWTIFQKIRWHGDRLLVSDHFQGNVPWMKCSYVVFLPFG